MVELQVVVLAVAGSSPVDHPIFHGGKFVREISHKDSLNQIVTPW